MFCLLGIPQNVILCVQTKYMNMKAFKTLLLLGMVVFVSCGDDEDKLLADEILGRWNFSLFTTTNCGNNSIGNVS